VVCFELLSLIVFVSQYGNTALHFAAIEGHLPVVEFLFERAPQLIEMQTNVSAAWCVSKSSLPDIACDSVGGTTTPLRCCRQSPFCCEVDHRSTPLSHSRAKQ
jgi:hypothetical protein